MKFVLKRSELEELQQSVNNVINKINEIDPESGAELIDVYDIIKKIKDTAHIQYRLLTNEFVIEFDDEFVKDWLGLYENTFIKLLPIFFKFYPIIEMAAPVITELQADFQAHMKKHTATVEADSNEA